MNPPGNPTNRTTRGVSLRFKTYAWLFGLTLSWLSQAAFAQPFAADARAMRFVINIVLNDFHTAQAGGGYVFSYDRNETDKTLSAKLERWFSGRVPQAIGMEPSEKQLLFGFYWAASMMPARSPCFDAMANDACQNDLSRWMARELDDDPRFVGAYEAARRPLGLPPLAHAGR